MTSNVTCSATEGTFGRTAWLRQMRKKKSRGNTQPRSVIGAQMPPETAQQREQTHRQRREKNAFSSRHSERSGSRDDERHRGENHQPRSVCAAQIIERNCLRRHRHQRRIHRPAQRVADEQRQPERDHLAQRARRVRTQPDLLDKLARELPRFAAHKRLSCNHSAALSRTQHRPAGLLIKAENRNRRVARFAVAQSERGANRL